MTSRKTRIAGLAKRGSTLLLGLAVSAGAGTVAADDLVNRPPQDGGAAYQSNWSGGSQYADEFSLSSESVLDSIQWWGSYLVEGGDDFKVRIFFDDSGPVVFPYAEYVSDPVTRTATSLSDSGGNPVFQYELALPSQLKLEAGIYYLSVINNEDYSTVNNDNPSDWLWLESSSGGGNDWIRQLDGVIWNAVAPDRPTAFAFALTGTAQEQPVPEPSILSLLGLGVFAMAGGKTLRRRGLA